jgi:transglutaminase-like putative cysteine protease
MRTRTSLPRAARPSRRAIGGALVVGIVAVAGLAIAQQPRRKLHEDLPITDPKPSPLIGATGSAGGNPAAFQSGGKLLTEPSVDDNRRSGEPVLGKGGFAADRDTSMTPDANTGADGTLHYASVFNPDVLPFKRMSAFDAVADSYKLSVRSTVQVGVPVSGTADTDKTRDRFWGSLMIELQPGKDIALPSVAPDMRILSYEVKPKVRLEFSKDGADNFYVRSSDVRALGPHRLVFLVDADAGYFAPALPTSRTRLTPRIVETLAPAAIKPVLPPAVRAAAEDTLRRNLRVNPDMALGDVFNALVGYFRAFQAKPMPSSGDIYRDLCDSQAGVCRHRAFAFMITANAVGIPTRYVHNEAHAFVEVWFPERGWQRIDLGGAALRMEVSGADDKTLHRPRADDPFAKPPQYRNNYTQLEGQIAGLTQQQIEDKRKSLDDAPASGQFDTQAGSAGGSGAAPPPDRITPDPTLPVAAHDPKKGSPVLEVITADASGYRGAAVRISGRVHVNGKALPDHPVDVYLSPKGMQGRSPVSLGRAVTAADGTFRQDFAIPAQLDLATYEIWLASPEDAYYNAALSN